MSANVDRHRKRRGTTKNTRLWSQIDAGDNKIVIAWSATKDHPGLSMYKIYMENLSKDLSCMKTLFVDNDQLNSTIWKQGILFNSDHQLGISCNSAVGLSPGSTSRPDIDSLEQYGAHSTWQMINTNANCMFESEFHHEVLHALGLRHEHNYPDRDEYLQFINERLDHNYRKVNATDWMETEYPFEMQSVMIYTDSSKFTKKNGQPVTLTSQRLTTTDALQIQELYCKGNPEFELKEHVMCSSRDELNFTRPVFVDRICDGIKDCHDGSDEDESMFECEKPLGCCARYNLWDRSTIIPSFSLTTMSQQFVLRRWPLTEYVYDIQSKESPSYRGFNAVSKRFELLQSEERLGHKRWNIGVPENPKNTYDLVKWYLKDLYLSRDEDCPPVGPQWSSVFKDKNVTLECAHQNRNVNYCSESSCDINARCINTLDSYKCVCNYGFTGDGKFCSKIIEIDECHSREHDCSENALCVDQQCGYACICNEGFIDRDSARPGRECESLVPSHGCCKEFSIFVSQMNVTEDALIGSCSIEQYSKFKYSPLRQSYKCEVEDSFLVKYPEYGILGAFKFTELTKLYFEYDGVDWSCVDRDENMNLIMKYRTGLEPLMDKDAYNNDLCFAGDFSTKIDGVDEFLYGKCMHRVGSTI